MNKQRKVVVFAGDDASPEVIHPTLEILKCMDLPITFSEPLLGQAAMDQTGQYFPISTRDAIDDSDVTLFGSTSGPSTAALFYLRWGKQTFANVRPCFWLPGFQSPLANPEGIDFVIVRENLEDLYLGLEGDLDDLAKMNFHSPHARKDVQEMAPGKYAIKIITEEKSRQVIQFAFELARKRADQNSQSLKRVTLTSKYNMLSVSDGYFRDIGNEVAKDYPDIEYETYIVDDFLCRMISDPQRLDVVVTPNLYGDILSDGAAGLIGGLGLAPSGCYGNDYAYFESAHGTAPDIAGQDSINPTATLLSAAMMLAHLGLTDEAASLNRAIRQVYANGARLTVDQGGQASTSEFCDAVLTALAL